MIVSFITGMSKSVVLTTVSFDLFLLLIQHPGCALGRERMARRTSSWPTLRRLAHLPANPAAAFGQKINI